MNDMRQRVESGAERGLQVAAYRHGLGDREMAQPLILTKPVSAVEAFAARLSIASGVLFVLLLGSLHLLEPEFDPTWRFVSEYALGDFGWMMHLAFFMLATSLASAGVAIFSQCSPGMSPARWARMASGSTASHQRRSSRSGYGA